MTNSYIHIRDFEKFVRDKFKHIIGGKGLVIPRMAVKLALDDVFKDDTLDAPEPAEEYMGPVAESMLAPSICDHKEMK